MPQRLPGSVKELVEAVLLAEDAAELPLCLYNIRSIGLEANGGLQAPQLLLGGEGGELGRHVLVHYDEHVVGVESEAIQDVHDFVFLDSLPVDLEPVFAVPPEVAGEHYDIAVEPVYRPPTVFSCRVIQK